VWRKCVKTKIWAFSSEAYRYQLHIKKIRQNKTVYPKVGLRTFAQEINASFRRSASLSASIPKA